MNFVQFCVWRPVVKRTVEIYASHMIDYAVEKYRSALPGDAFNDNGLLPVDKNFHQKLSWKTVGKGGIYYNRDAERVHGYVEIACSQFVKQCLDKNPIALFEEYNEYYDHPRIGSFEAHWTKGMLATIAHEIAHIFAHLIQFWRGIDIDSVERYGINILELEEDNKLFYREGLKVGNLRDSHHNALWRSIYGDLREKFVHDIDEVELFRPKLKGSWYKEHIRMQGNDYHVYMKPDLTPIGVCIKLKEEKEYVVFNAYGEPYWDVPMKSLIDAREIIFERNGLTK